MGGFYLVLEINRGGSATDGATLSSYKNGQTDAVPGHLMSTLGSKYLLNIFYLPQCKRVLKLYCTVECLKGMNTPRNVSKRDWLI